MNAHTVVALQPGYLPWLGFFDQAIRADTFILLDDVQFTTRDWRTRNRIRTDKDWIWLSVPVKLEKSYFEYRLNEVPISYENRWVQKHLGAIQHNYRKAPYFNEIYPILENQITANYEKLIDLDLELIYVLSDYLGIDRRKYKLSSDFRVPETVKKEDRILFLLSQLEMSEIHYLSGNSAKGYIDEGLFQQKGYPVIWHDYEHPVYEQIYEPFMPFMSVIDCLFNFGPKSGTIISGKKV